MQSRIPRPAKALALLVATTVAVALAAGCGSSGGSSTSSSSGSGGSSASGGEIPIGVIGSFGTHTSGGDGGELVAKAWASTVNAAGGINGHQIKLFIKTDNNSPAAGLTAVKELVEQDHVVAIVGETSNVDTAWAPYVEAKGVPVVGGLPINLTFVTNPNFFASGGNALALQYGTLVEAKKIGDKVALLYCAESAACAQAVTLDKALAGAIGGVSIAVAAPVSATAPDYTAVCQKVKSAGAQTLYIAATGEVAIRVAQSCREQGVTAPLLASDGALTAAFAGNPATNNTIGIEVVAPFFDSSTPATKAYRDALAKYAPNIGASDGPIAEYTWVGGKLFEAAVKASGSTEVTSASVKKGLYALKDETLGGLTSPLNFTEGKAAQINCYFTYKIVDDKFTTPNGLRTACAPDALVAGIVSSLPKS